MTPEFSRTKNTRPITRPDGLRDVTDAIETHYNFV